MSHSSGLPKRRTVTRATSEKIPLSEAVMLAGGDRWKDVPLPTRRQYEREGIPATQLANELLAAWRGGRREADIAPSTDKSEWLSAGYQERRMFTAFVEALKRVDAEGDADAWRAAWYGVVRAAMLGLSQLSGWGSRTDWANIHHGGSRRAGLDHWKKVNRESEEQMVLRVRDESESPNGGLK